jgi:excisionase family DNA binding protein
MTSGNKSAQLLEKRLKGIISNLFRPDNVKTQGLTHKPLFKIVDVSSLFNVSRPTIHEWIKDGKLKPYKIRRRIFFLWSETEGQEYIIIEIEGQDK